MIRIPHSHLHVTARTHPGMAGKQNEDRFAVTAYRLGPNNSIPSLFAIVADGIGGHRAGEVAAEMAVNTVSHVVALNDGEHPLETIQHAIQAASQEIATQARDDTQRLGMGTTCACAWVIDDRLYTASVGDSRIYLMRGGDLHQLTTDHTWIQEAIDKGILDAEAARGHPNIHVIRRYLGGDQPPQADIRLRLKEDESDTQARENQGMYLIPGDLLLLCTDGLTDEVSDPEIEQILRQAAPPPGSAQNLEAATQILINLACQRRGRDNITIVLVCAPGSPPLRKKRENFISWLLGK